MRVDAPGDYTPAREPGNLFFHNKSIKLQFRSVQFKMVSRRSGRPVCAPHRLLEVFSAFSFETVPVFI